MTIFDKELAEVLRYDEPLCKMYAELNWFMANFPKEDEEQHPRITELVYLIGRREEKLDKETWERVRNSSEFKEEVSNDRKNRPYFDDDIVEYEKDGKSLTYDLFTETLSGIRVRKFFDYISCSEALAVEKKAGVKAWYMEVRA